MTVASHAFFFPRKKGLEVCIVLLTLLVQVNVLKNLGINQSTKLNLKLVGIDYMNTLYLFLPIEGNTIARLAQFPSFNTTEETS